MGCGASQGPGTAAAAPKEHVVLSGGWAPRMGKYEFDGYNDGKARFRNKSCNRQTWHNIVWSSKFGMWQIATNPNGKGPMPLYVNRGINQKSLQLPPSEGWVIHENANTKKHVQDAGHLVLEFSGKESNEVDCPIESNVIGGNDVVSAVVVGTVISSEPAVPRSHTGAMPPLKEAVDIFRQELGLAHGSNLAADVDAACQELGLDVQGLSVIEKAEKCWEQLQPSTA